PDRRVRPRVARRGRVLYERDDLGAGSTARAAGIAYDAYAEDVDVALAERAIERFRAFSGAGDFRFAHTPYLWFVTEGGAAAGAIREQVERMRHHDRDVELLDADAIRREFPVLRADDIVAAGIARTAGTVDPVAYVDLLAAKAREAGADVRTGTPATVALDPPRVNGEAYDAVVVAAGAWTGGVLAEAGVDVPLEPYRVQALVADGPAIPILYDATREYYARPHPRGVVAGDGVTAPADPDDYDGDADEAFRERTTARLRERVVNARAPVQRSWAGVCARTPTTTHCSARWRTGCTWRRVARSRADARARGRRAPRGRRARGARRRRGVRPDALRVATRRRRVRPAGRRRGASRPRGGRR
uniref:NAD(P)/FAD-dependent oxidoreductase n=1 Tax=Halarchaeum acidiphilum TaxID=489138 RepID=UPI000381D276